MLRKKAFSLVELLIVVAVIALLIGFIVPVFWSLVNEAGKTADISQGKLLKSAVDHYEEQFQFSPGYFDESYLCNDSVYTQFTSSENLTISILGGNTTNGETSWHNLSNDAVGRGAYSNGGYIGAFYNPRDGELRTANQTLGDDNDFPEIATISSGVPILYWRVRGEDHNWDQRMPVAWDDQEENNNKGSVYRKTNEDFLGSDQLNGKYDQRNNSILSNHIPMASDGTTSDDYKYSEWYGANSNLAWILNIDNPEFRTWSRYRNTNPNWPAFNSMNMKMESRYGGSRGSISAGYLLLSAGADGIYLSRDQTREVNEAHLVWNCAINEGNYSGNVYMHDIFDVDNGTRPNHIFLSSFTYRSSYSDKIIDANGNDTRYQYKQGNNSKQYHVIPWENLKKYDDVFMTGGTTLNNQ